MMNTLTFIGNIVVRQAHHERQWPFNFPVSPELVEGLTMNGLSELPFALSLSKGLPKTSQDASTMADMR